MSGSNSRDDSYTHVTVNEETPICADSVDETSGKHSPEVPLRASFFSGRSIYIVALLFQVCLNSWTPILMELAVWNSATQKKDPQFLPESPQIVAFFLSVCVANLMSLITRGKQGLFQCWSLTGVKTLLPVSVLHGTSECLQLRSMVWLDGTSRQVLVQLKLPLIGFFSFFFLKRSLPFPRTLSASVILLAGIGYILSQAQVKVSERSWEYCYYGIPLGVTTVALSAAAGLLLDAITKTQKDVPYFAQIAQLRISSLFVVTLGMLVHALIENTTYKILFYGWNNRVVFLVFWLMLKDYMTILLLKRLTALHVALCASASLCLTYVLDTLIFVRQWKDFRCLVFVLIIALSIATFASIGQAAIAQPAASLTKEGSKGRSSSSLQVQQRPSLSLQSTSSNLDS